MSILLIICCFAISLSLADFGPPCPVGRPLRVKVSILTASLPGRDAYLFWTLTNLFGQLTERAPLDPCIQVLLPVDIFVGSPSSAYLDIPLVQQENASSLLWRIHPFPKAMVENWSKSLWDGQRAMYFNHLRATTYHVAAAARPGSVESDLAVFLEDDVKLRDLFWTRVRRAVEDLMIMTGLSLTSSFALDLYHCQYVQEDSSTPAAEGPDQFVVRPVLWAVCFPGMVYSQAGLKALLPYLSRMFTPIGSAGYLNKPVEFILNDAAIKGDIKLFTVRSDHGMIFHMGGVSSRGPGAVATVGGWDGH